MISLLFRFFGDSTPLKKEAEKAKGEMSQAGASIGKEFGAQLKGAIMSTVGIGAIVGQIKKAAAEAMQGQMDAAADVAGLGTRETIALTRAAKASGLTREQIMMTGRENPELFSRFISQFEPGMSESDLNNLAETGRTVGTALSNVGASVGAGLANLYNRIVGLTASLWGSATGNNAMSVSGRNMLVTGQSSGPQNVSPVVEFVRSKTAMDASSAAFGEMVDAVNRQIEETRKVREAVEKN